MGDKIYGLLGHSTDDSWAVPIHRAFGCPNYRLIEAKAEQLETFLRREDLGGLDIAAPYRQAVLPYCDVQDDVSRAIGNVTTVVRKADGKLYGCNTDTMGFRYMANLSGIQFRGKKVLILGSGGISLTVQHVVRELQARECAVSSCDNYRNIERHANAEVIVSAVPVGSLSSADSRPVDLKKFPNCSGVLDLVYNPRRTALLYQAEKLGIPHMDGLPMRVAQAAAAQEQFFGTAIPNEKIGRVLNLMRQKSQNVVLIGMPGCGKSTIGQELAKLTGRLIVDIDNAVEKRDGRSIPEIFAQDGEETFRKLEREEAVRAGKQPGKIVVTGGGIVKDERNYYALHRNGRIYQLERALNLLPTDGRPLSQSTGISKLYQERAPLYARFRDAAIDNNGTVTKTAAAIWLDFCQHAADD